MTAFKHSLYSSTVLGFAAPITWSIGTLQTFNQSFVRLVGSLIAKHLSIVLVTCPFASGISAGSFGKRLIRELASNDVVEASWSVSTAARDVSRIDSSDGVGVGAGVGTGVGTGVGANIPVTSIVCQL